MYICSVVSGTKLAVDELEGKRVITVVGSSTSHAFHSQMMEPIWQFTEQVKKINLQPKKSRISNWYLITALKRQIHGLGICAPQYA